MPSDFQSAPSILARMKLSYYCFVDRRILKPNYLGVLNLNYCGIYWCSTGLCSFAFTLYSSLDVLRLLLCPVTGTGDGHLYFSWNVRVLNPTADPADRLGCFSSGVLCVLPATACCHQPSGRWPQSCLLWSGVTSLMWSHGWIRNHPSLLST